MDENKKGFPIEDLESTDHESGTNLDQSRFRIKKRGRQKQYFRISMMATFLLLAFLLVTVLTGNRNTDIAEEDTTNQAPAKQEENVEPVSTKSNDDNDSDETHESADQSNEDNEEFDTPTDEELSDEEDTIIEHEIEKGDSLYRLSIKYYDSPQYQQFLAAFNDIDNTKRLNIGDIVMVPFPPSNEWYEDGEDVLPASGDILYHEVKAGDTLYSISSLYYKTPKHNNYIAEYNNITQPDDLKIGDKIAIPAPPEGE